MTQAWLLVFFAAVLATGAQSARPGVVVPLPVDRPVPELSDREVMMGELGATVLSASEAEVSLAVQDACVPRVGDRVELFRVTRGFASSAGFWQVTYAEGDLVRAAPAEVREAPRKGMAAIVYSAVPAGMLGHIGFENTPRPQMPADQMMAWAERHLTLVGRARADFDEGQRLLASPAGHARAVEALRAAAELNHPHAAFALYQVYRRDQESTEAAKWLRRAAELGMVEAQTAIAAAFEDGSLSGDTEKARAWRRKASAPRR